MSKKRDEQHESTPRWLWGLGLALGILALSLLLQLEGTATGAYLLQLEHKSLDSRFQLRGHLAPTERDSDIVILTIDDEGLQLFEHQDLLAAPPDEGGDGALTLPNEPWPWHRQTYGLAVDYLRAAGARAIFFDFLFTGDSPYESYTLEDDELFAAACGRAGNVFHTLLFEEPVDAPGEGSVERSDEYTHLRARLLERSEQQLRSRAIPGAVGGLAEYRRVQAPLSILASQARGLGVINATLDPDGVVRRVELLSRFGDAAYPAISLALAAHTLGEVPIEWNASGPAITVGETEIPVDGRGRMLLNWHGGAKTYTTLALHRQILKVYAQRDPALDRDLFEDKVVLIGTSAVGLADLKANPFGAHYPGVEVHATALDNILNRDFLVRPGGLKRALSMGAVFLVAALLFVRKQSAGTTLALFLAVLLAYVAVALALFTYSQTWIDLVVPSGGLVLLFGGAQTIQYFTVGRQKRQMRSAFQRYLPPAVVSEVLKLPADQLKLGGDRREMTAYFSDIQGFTSISEGLAPEQLVGMLNIYLSEMSDIISSHHGTLDKYIGDCIMAFWGAPLARENGALDACLAALENQERAIDLRRRFREQNLPEVHARIGINTGPMLVGNMGSDQHFDFTVMGDAVNLASRLEGANKQYGTWIMLGPETVTQAGDAIETRELDLMRVKGRAEPVKVFELLAARGGLSDPRRRLVEEYGKALGLYRSRDWPGALAGFERCLALDAGDGPSQTYRDRCVSFCESPPSDDWDGVYVMRTK